MRREDVELLAPAGTWEALEAAVFAGADAVYLGGSAFGARAYAENFGPEELQRAITFAHLHHVRIYVTVNTLVTDEEMKALGTMSRSSAISVLMASLSRILASSGFAAARYLNWNCMPVRR